MHGDKLSSNMNRLLLSLMRNSGQSFKYLNFIESIYNDTGLGYVFVNIFRFATTIDLACGKIKSQTFKSKILFCLADRLLTGCYAIDVSTFSVYESNK